MNFERGEIVVAAADIRAHLAKRSDDTLHRALLEGIVTGDFGGEGLSGENAGQEPNRGAGIFRVEGAPGAFEAVKAAAGNLNGATVVCDTGAERFDAGQRALTIASCGEIAEFAGAVSEGGEHGVAVGDGFVAGKFEAAGERVGGVDGFGFHDESQFSMGKLGRSGE